MLDITQRHPSLWAVRMATPLREERLARGLSQEGLARAVGASRQTIVNIERGQAVPNVLLALAIGAALGIAVEALFRQPKETT
jgi:putative transcriptional regulator